MSNHTRQRFSLFQFECRVILDSAFPCSRSNVESHSTALSAVPGRMSTHNRKHSALPGRMSSNIRQRFPPFQVEYRVILDSLSAVPDGMSNHTHSAFRCSWSYFESLSTALSAVACRVTRQLVLLFKVRLRVTLESAFDPSRWNVESHSTAFSDLQVRISSHTRQRFAHFQFECRVTEDSAFFPGRMSSHTRQRILLFLVECRVTLDSAFCCSRSKVESHSTGLSALRGQMSTHIRQRLPTFQVECRMISDSVLRPSMPNVESHSTALSVLPG